MPDGKNTKTQAQKRAEKEAKQAEAQKKRAEEHAAKKAMFAKKFDNSSASDDDDADEQKNSHQQQKREKKPWELSDDDEYDYEAEEEEEEGDQNEKAESKESAKNKEEEEDSGDDWDLDYGKVDRSRKTNRQKELRDQPVDAGSGPNQKQQRVERKLAEKNESSKTIDAISGSNASTSASSPSSTTTAAPSGRGRLVMNHSTHCDDLIPVLKKACHKLDSRFTITPGIIRQSQSRREGGLVIDRQRSENACICRLVAKNQSTLQEIAIQTPDGYDHEKLHQIVLECLERVRTVLAGDDDQHAGGGSAGGGPVLISNKDAAAALSLQADEQRKAEQQASHQHKQQRERDAREAKAEAQRAKTLQTKGVAKTDTNAYASRDEAIVSGKSRGRNAMK